MKYLILALLLLPMAITAEAAKPDHSKNAYACQIWEPNREGAEARVDPINQVHLHALQDGIHELEIQWYHWTLNVSVKKKGVIPELLGAASHTNLKLRSHAPDVSIWCDKVEALEGIEPEKKSCRTECQTWYPMPRNCRQICE